MIYLAHFIGEPFTAYWNHTFRDDLRAMLDARPASSCSDLATTIQPLRLSRRNPVVRRWARPRRENFAVALYLLLRLDRFVAGYRPNRYDDFAHEFGAPAFIGDCPGGCCLDLQPMDVLFCLGAGNRRWQDNVPVIPDPALEPEVRAIVRGLCERLLPNSDAGHFVFEFMQGWQPPIALLAMRNEQAMRDRRQATAAVGANRRFTE